jgi:predicted DNA-binding transcriptional regulator YafY
MNRRANPVEKAARLLDLVPFIYTHQGISVTDLAAEFSIEIEELLADLNALWMCGETRFDLIELEFDSGFVYIRNADALNVVRSLSVQEVTAILFGLDLLKESISAERADLLSDIELVKKVIGTPLQRLVASEPMISGGVITAIDDALKNRQRLLITYHSVAEDVTSERVLHPIEKRIENGVELLLAFCESANALRSFRLDRIQKAELLPMPITQTGRVQSGAIESVTIKVHHDLRRVFETLGKLTPGIGDTYTVEIYNQSWLIREVLASGGAIEVVEPEALRAEISRQAGLVASQYR